MTEELVVLEEEIEEAVEDGPPNLAQLLAKFEGSPSTKQIETWKQQHGEIFCTGFSETEFYVYRPLTWKEHKDLTKRLSAPLEEGEEPRTEADLQESVVDTCLLWTSVANYHQKGGTIPAIFEMVMINSNFTNPQVVAQFTIKL